MIRFMALCGLTVIGLTLAGCQSILSSILRCEDRGCCTYYVEIKPPEYFKYRALSSSEKSNVDSDFREFDVDGLVVYLSDIKLLAPYSRISLSNTRSKPIDIKLRNTLFTEDGEYSPIYATLRTDESLKSRRPDEVRKMPIEVRLKPGELVSIQYAFPLATARDHEYTQAISIGQDPEDLLVSRKLVLTEAASICVLGGSHGWQPVQDKVSADLSIYNEQEAGLIRKQKRATK